MVNMVTVYRYDILENKKKTLKLPYIALESTWHLVKRVMLSALYDFNEKTA